MQIHLKKIHDKATLPVQAHAGDAGYDLTCVEDFRIMPGQTVMVSTGLVIADAPKVFEVPTYGLVRNTVEKVGTAKQPYFLQIMSRSGLASKGLYVIGGVVDASYRGEIKVLLHNGNESNPASGLPEGLGYDFVAGEKIAQLVVQSISISTEFVQATSESTTSRQDGGFGSTGA